MVGKYNQCAHRGGPICQGRIYRRVVEPVDGEPKTRTLRHDSVAKNIVCPWYGWEFDLRTGAPPGRRQVRPGEVNDCNSCTSG